MGLPLCPLHPWSSARSIGFVPEPSFSSADARALVQVTCEPPPILTFPLCDCDHSEASCKWSHTLFFRVGLISRHIMSSGSSRCVT